MIEIRYAAVTDAAAISPLLRQLGYETTIEEARVRLTALAGSATDAVFVACEDDRVCGVASVHLVTMFHTGRQIARMTALVVDEPARGHGAGAQLVAAVETYAATAKCDRVELTSGDARIAAHQFYEARGYHRVSQRFIKALET
jgi:GNAT superfamily N-acetyltransferase